MSGHRNGTQGHMEHISSSRLFHMCILPSADKSHFEPVAQGQPVSKVLVVLKIKVVHSRHFVSSPPQRTLLEGCFVKFLFWVDHPFFYFTV